MYLLFRSKFQDDKINVKITVCLEGRKIWQLHTIWNLDRNRRFGKSIWRWVASVRGWILKKYVLGMWNELVCLRMKTSGGLLWIREWTYAFLKRRELSGKLSRMAVLWAPFAVERRQVTLSLLMPNINWKGTITVTVCKWHLMASVEKFSPRITAHRCPLFQRWRLP